MGKSACKCVHLASSDLPCVPVSLKAKLCVGVTLCRSNIHSNVLLPFSLICMCTFYTHKRYHPNLRKCHGLPWTLKWKGRVLLSYVGTFRHGLVYTSSLNSVNITIEIYSMPKLNPPIFRTPMTEMKICVMVLKYHWGPLAVALRRWDLWAIAHLAYFHTPFISKYSPMHWWTVFVSLLQNLFNLTFSNTPAVQIDRIANTIPRG